MTSFFLVSRLLITVQKKRDYEKQDLIPENVTEKMMDFIEKISALGGKRDP